VADDGNGLKLTLDDLTEFSPGNPRTIDDASLGALQASLAEFGDLSGLVWDRTHGLVCGHQRLRALRERHGADLKLVEWRGLWKLVCPSGHFPIRVVEWPLERCIAANLAANNALLSGLFTPAAADLVSQVEVSMPDLAASLRLCDLEIPIPFVPTEDMLPDPLAPPDLVGEDDRAGRFILVYVDEEQKQRWMDLVGIDGDKVVYTLDDLEPGNGS
jgi:hypothetical protein